MKTRHPPGRPIAPDASPPRSNLVDRLRIRHLKLLERIADLGSLSAAAERLNVSQPAATKMLHEIEAAFGRSLIERTARGARLNPNGTLALDRLRVALGALDALGRALEVEPATPILRIGMVPAMVVGALPTLVKTLDRTGRLPRLIIVEGTVDRLVQAVRDGEIDCAVTPLDASVRTDAPLRFVPLWDEGLTIAAAPDHPLSRKRSVSLATLTDERWAVAPRRASTRRVFEQWFIDAGLAPPEPYVESISFHANLTLASTGAVLAVAPQSAVRHYQGLGMVRELRLAQPLPRSPLFFVASGDVAALPEMELVLRLLRALPTAGP